MKKIKISILFFLFILSLFFWKVNTSKAFLGTAACNAKGGSCGWVFCGSDEDRLGLCDYGIDPCCRKKLVDTSGADPDPIGAGLEAGGTVQNPNANLVGPAGGTLQNPNTGLGGPAGGTVTPGTSGIPMSTTATSPSVASPSGGSGETGGLVPCTNNCTLCHLVLGFKNIYDYLLVLLLSVTTLVVVVAGVMYMVSSGDKGMIDKAKSALTYALTAMILALVAWLIINATLSALGYTKVGSWYNFTCDTAQTQGPTGGTGGGTLPGTGKGGGISGKGSDIQVPQDGSKLAQVLEKEKSAVYAWGGDPNSRNTNGNLNTDCSGWIQAIYKETYGVNIPRSSSEQGNQAFNYSQLKNGTILESPGHVGIYYNGSVYHNSGTGRDVQVANLDNYLGNHNVTEIRLPPS